MLTNTSAGAVANLKLGPSPILQQYVSKLNRSIGFDPSFNFQKEAHDKFLSDAKVSRENMKLL